MLFSTLYFVGLPVGQVKPKNNLPEAISACLGQALISSVVSDCAYGTTVLYQVEFNLF